MQLEAKNKELSARIGELSDSLKEVSVCQMHYALPAVDLFC